MTKVLPPGIRSVPPPAVRFLLINDYKKLDLAGYLHYTYIKRGEIYE